MIFVVARFLKIQHVQQQLDISRTYGNSQNYSNFSESPYVLDMSSFSRIDPMNLRTVSVSSKSNILEIYFSPDSAKTSESKVLKYV